MCARAPRGRQILTVHVENAYGVTTDFTMTVLVRRH
jgi:hypothetical protein